jgi:hypothetical protein
VQYNPFTEKTKPTGFIASWRRPCAGVDEVRCRAPGQRAGGKRRQARRQRIPGGRRSRRPRTMSREVEAALAGLETTSRWGSYRGKEEPTAAGKKGGRRPRGRRAGGALGRTFYTDESNLSSCLNRRKKKLHLQYTPWGSTIASSTPSSSELQIHR